MVDLSNYPKSVRLRDGKEAVVRILTPSDEVELSNFMRELPPLERVYFRDDVTDPKVIREWCFNIDLDRVIPLIAIQDERIVANWSMHLREHGWTRHLANFRGIVHPDWRRNGLATQMVYELLSIGQKLEIERAIIELVSPQKRLLAHFISLGFNVEAVLKDWVKDFQGRYHDMLIMMMKIEPAWRKMEELILDYGTHGG